MTDDFAAGMRRAAEIVMGAQSGFHDGISADWHPYSVAEFQLFVRNAILAAIPASAPWTPPPEAERPEGFKCLGWLSGVWQTVRWQRRWGWLDKDGLCRDPEQFHPAPPAPEALP